MKTRATLLLTLLASVTVTGCAMYGGERTADTYPVGSRVPAEFIGPSGRPVGTAILKQTPNGVLMDVELRNAEPGWHGFHVHETGECEAPDFESAGGHYDPEDDEHGFETEGGYHAGDFPNIYVNQRGRAEFQVFSEKLSLGGKNRLFDRDGSAIVIHSAQDDYRSQPSGDSGERIACAVINQRDR